MDERAVNAAAIEAIHDLAVDCEIKQVCKGSDEGEWCVQFSGKYGQFCDNFQNQFGQENSPEVMREKIKAFLIKQVAKIRGNTGRKRKPAAGAREDREPSGGLLTEPLKLVGEVLSRATGMATQVVSQASAVAETTRATLSAADLVGTEPATAGIQATALETQTEQPPRMPGRTTITIPAKAKKAKKATKRASRQATGRSKKAAASKSAARAKKAAKKASRKSSRAK
ncbi:MAG TPA: hypothetical protein VGC87_20525 [Pyrinomonadaceae bacterium]|jgi:hypothetical protein